ncbi:MAG: efflux RND transporter permease subunit, partial [Pseudomonadota bacterium]
MSDTPVQGPRGAMRGTLGIAGLSVRRPYLAAVLNLLIVIAGLAAWFGVEVRELPSVEATTVLVRGTYPGASPETVDATVTSVLEKAIARVNGLQRMRASSEEGNFRINAVFDDSRPLNDVSNDVREAVAGVTHRLPDDVDDLRVFKSDRDANAIFTVAITAGDRNVNSFAKLVDDQIIPAFAAINGVSEVRRWGGRRRVMRVAVAPSRLAAHGLSVGEVVDVLRAAEFDVPVGSFEAGQLEVLVRADATVSDPERVARLMVRDPVRLGDVASVYYGESRRENVARLDGQEIVTLGLVRQPRSNTVEIAQEARDAVERLRAQYPRLTFAVVGDSAIFIQSALSEAGAALVAALLIVIGVIWLFLGRLGATLVPAVTIPVALIGSLGVIWLLGFSLNLITLLALVLATGLVVDDAIVVTENIHRCRTAGMAPRAAAVIGTRQVFFAVVATTITLVAVFLPISLLPSTMGKVFTEFGFVLCATIILSSLVALTACPMIAARLTSLGRDGGTMDAIGAGLTRLYAASIIPSIRTPLVVITLAVIAAGVSALLYGGLGEEVTPAEDRGRITVRLQGPDGTGLDYTDRQVALIEGLFEPFQSQAAVTAVQSVTGRWDPNRGEIKALLAPWEDRALTQHDIEATLRPQLEDIAGARARIIGGNSLGVGGGGEVGLRFAVVGADYPTIAAGADALAERMEEIAGLGAARVDYQATQPQLSIRIDRARAADLQVSMETLSTTLRALIDEMEVSNLIVGDQDIPVFLQSAA